jgi:hypothetical protein
MVEGFPATLKAIFDPNYGNIRPYSQPKYINSRKPLADLSTNTTRKLRNSHE